MTQLKMLSPPTTSSPRSAGSTSRRRNRRFSRISTKALDLLKSMTSEEERERATVYMEGLAQMRSDWLRAPKSAGSGKRKAGKGPAGR